MISLGWCKWDVSQNEIYWLSESTRKLSKNKNKNYSIDIFAVGWECGVRN